MYTITILLIERTQSDLAQMCRLLMQDAAFQIIGCCTDVHQAYAQIQLYHPDVVLCEMILNGNDGLSLLRRMPRSAVRPLFLMTSRLASDCILQNACDLGADYFIVKPIDPVRLKQTIRMLTQSRPAPPVHESDPDLLLRIHQLLIRQGFTTRYQGFRYLATALELIMGEPSLLSSLTKALYVHIAGIHDTLPTRVERDIRHAIHCVCEHSGVHPMSNGTMLRHLVHMLRAEAGRR